MQIALIFFLQAYMTKETKSFLPFEYYDSPDKLMDQSLPSYYDFFCGIRSCSSFEKTQSDSQNLIDSGCNSEAAFKNSSLQKFLPRGKTTMPITVKMELLKYAVIQGFSPLLQ